MTFEEWWSETPEKTIPVAAGDDAWNLNHCMKAVALAAWEAGRDAEFLLNEMPRFMADYELIEALDIAATDWEYEIGSLKSAAEHESAGKAKRFAQLIRDFIARIKR